MPARTPTGAAGSLQRRGPARAHPRRHPWLPLQRRGLSEGPCAPEDAGSPHLPKARAADHRGKRPAGSAQAAGPPRAQPRRHHRDGPRGHGLGNGHDRDDDRRRARPPLLRRRPLLHRNPRFHVDRRPNRWAALEPVRQAAARRFGGLDAGSAEGLVLRHDNGSNYAAADFQREIRFLGIESSPSFVRQPQGNGVAERLIRTVKERILWTGNFDTIEDLTQELREFVERCNVGWLCQRHGHRTPSQIGAERRALDRCAAVEITEAA